MKVSLNWVHELSNVTFDRDELLEKVGSRLGAIEEVTDLGPRYKDILIVKVVECVSHPDADKLHVCKIDDGKVAKKVERDSKGLVQVVCGAPNVKAGMLAVWIPPGTTVPSTFDKDPFVIGAKELRGIASNGMLASPAELAISSSHDGLLEVDKTVKAGTTLAKAYDLNDTIIDIENKMFTHRPDCFGILGVAREISGIHHRKFTSPDWYLRESKLKAGSGLMLEVKNELPELVPRFCVATIKDVTVQPSPIWLQVALSKLGIKPINNIVDITNYVMLLTAQPLHAYDYDKLKTGKLGIRLSKDGENLKLLGGKDLKLSSGAIVITDGVKPVGLGGIMGGADTEVDGTTKNIVLECANFDMNTTRRAAMEYGLFTDAATRFTKGQSPLQILEVMAKALEMLEELAGGKFASKPIDNNKEINYPPTQVVLHKEFINDRLGLELETKEISELLENVEFVVEADQENKEAMYVSAPFWRTDIETPEDIVEEVGRLYGYENLPAVLPTRSVQPAKQQGSITTQRHIRQIMSSAGANEVLSYSFVHGDLLTKAGQDGKLAFKLRNAISPDLQYYRLSITPSLLEKVHSNIKLGYDRFGIFELGKVHGNSEIDEDNLPKELGRLAFIYASKDKSSGASFYQSKKYVEYLLSELGLKANYQPLSGFTADGHKMFGQMIAPFETERSAVVRVGDKLLGVVGEYRSSVVDGFKLPPRCSGFELFLSGLQRAESTAYQPLNRFPALEQDMCLKLSSGLSYGEVSLAINNYVKELSSKHGYEYQLQPIDIFQHKDDKLHKQITWRITLAHPSRTLVTEESNILLDEVSERAKSEFGAERV